MEAHPVTARLITEHAGIQPGAQTRIGVLFQMEHGWHIYAQDPGEAGLATSVVWSAPRGLTIGPLQWPTPRAFSDPGNIQTFGYEDTVVLSSALTLTSTAEGTVPIQAEVEWLACRDICIPGSATLTVDLPVTAALPAVSADADRFQSR